METSFAITTAGSMQANKEATIVFLIFIVDPDFVGTPVRMKQNEKLISVTPLRQMSAGIIDDAAAPLALHRDLNHNNGCFIITILKHQSIYAATSISDHLFHYKTFETFISK
ncbi:hypothetical protein MJ585_07545 [Klebsiella pneumoniae]|nr:hypothetical protein MJ585_07545 [Klebsiella pneumoniae]